MAKLRERAFNLTNCRPISEKCHEGRRKSKMENNLHIIFDCHHKTEAPQNKGKKCRLNAIMFNNSGWWGR
jgi:hypothetical protein